MRTGRNSTDLASRLRALPAGLQARFRIREDLDNREQGAAGALCPVQRMNICRVAQDFIRIRGTLQQPLHKVSVRIRILART